MILIYILISLFFVALSIFLMKKLNVAGFYSKGILISIILSTIANISLSQNYINSLIPEVNDGIGISNFISYWIIGEDNWRIDLFKTAYDQSIYITLFLLLFYIVVMLVENRKIKMVNP